MERVGFAANVDQTPEASGGLLMLFSLIPAAFGIITIAILLFYPLTDNRVAEIGAELISRRGQSEAGSGAT